ncbi:unnamed protein product [Spirodela intermedia]|uniref:Uncharacterized protein n=1 Tax=Spirodela intermedia TaxID=51605 RepID=A0A7I8KJW4_SPIIN|nr:unnamed protein product [Spirodela intermedia]
MDYSFSFFKSNTLFSSSSFYPPYPPSFFFSSYFDIHHTVYG